ncbi:MAG: HTTM domain-containing protein [Planctomycetota bacterium]|nr:HTTM domain-containing protein [Planctomycetota bacterium]
MRDGLRRVFTLDVRSIALMRIAAAAVLLWDTIDRIRHLADHYFADSAIPFEVAEEYYKFLPTWSLHLLSESPAYQTSLFVLQAVVACLLLVGWYGRIMAAISWILFASLLARVPPLLTGGDMLLCSLLFWLTLLPCSRCLSVHSKGKAPAGSVYSVATIALLMQFVIMYTLTGIFKINSEWVDGDALQIILSDTGLAKPVGLWLTKFPLVLIVLTWGSIFLELAAQVLLLSPYQTHRIRTIGLIAFFGLHIGIFLTMEVLVFSIISIAGLIGLIPSSWWNIKPLAKLTQTSASDAVPATNIKTKLPRLSNVFACWGLVLFVTVACCHLFTYATGIYVSSKIQWVAHQFRFDQRWNMFDNPHGLCYRFIAEVRTADGKKIDILRSRDKETDNRTAPPNPTQFQSGRWLLLYRQMVSDQYFLQRIHAVRYLANHNPTRLDLPSAGDIDGKEIRLYVSVGSHESRKTTPPSLMTYIDLRATGEYYLGEPHGTWIRHDDQGRLLSTGTFDQGFREGEWKNYHPNGQLATLGHFTDDQEHGEWTMWDADGLRTANGFFEYGQQEGTWTFWYEDGQSEQAEYVAGKRVEHQKP